MLALSCFFPKLQPELEAPQVPKRSQSPHEFPLLQHSSLPSRSKATLSFQQAEFVELLSLCTDTTACPSEALAYLRMSPLF